MSSSPTELVAVVMPQMGVSVADGTVLDWQVGPGDRVVRDQALCQISTDKIDSDIPAPIDAIVEDLLVAAGETVAVGTVLAWLRPVEAGEAAAPQPEEQASSTPPISPVVARMASEHGIDLSTLKGSGRGGRVSKADLAAHLEQHKPDPPTQPLKRPQGQTLHTDSPYQVAATGEPLSPQRRQIAAHMRRSLDTAAHCTTIAEADLSRINGLRGNMSPLPYVIEAVCLALRQHPELNAILEGDRLFVSPEINIGVSVSLGEQGLIVPVLHRADELSLTGIRRRLDDLIDRARQGRLNHDDVAGGTFTVTSPGRYGALAATPIIHQPQVAILDFETITKRAVVVEDSQGNDALAIRPMSYLCLSWDHRALDGAAAAQFLASLRTLIENG